MTQLFSSMGSNLRAVVIGASGGIGQGFIDHLAASDQVSEIWALSRTGRPAAHPKVRALTFDFEDEDNIAAGAEVLRETGLFDIVIVATGLLHGEGISPEKNMRALDRDSFLKSLSVNTVGPALTAKYMLKLLHRDRKTVFAALSARVGSISDNRMGGWYAYRAAKAALNMTLKCLAIEHGRRYDQCVIIGLHPGTVDTGLSAPFQGNVPEGKLFTPDYSTGKMLAVIDQVTPEDSGHLLDFAGLTVEP